MFRFLKNHLQGARFALLKLLVHISFHYFEWCGSMHYVTPEAICGCVFLTAAFDTVLDMDDTEPQQYNSSTVSKAAVRNTQPQIASGVT